MRKPPYLSSSLSICEMGMQNSTSLDIPGGAVVKNMPANPVDMGSIPGQLLSLHALQPML